MTPDGHETLITKEEWIKVFPAINVEKSDDDETEIQPVKQKPFSKRTIGDIEYNDSLI